MHGVAVGQDAAPRAHQDSQAGLLEDVDVVVVGVAHGPTAGVSLGLFTRRRVD